MRFRLINKKRRQYPQSTVVSEHYVIIRLSNTCCVNNTAPAEGVNSEAEPSRSHQHGSLAPGWTLSLNVEKYLQNSLQAKNADKYGMTEVKLPLMSLRVEPTAKSSTHRNELTAQTLTGRAKLNYGLNSTDVMSCIIVHHLK